MSSYFCPYILSIVFQSGEVAVLSMREGGTGLIDCSSVCVDATLRRALVGDGTDAALAALLRSLEQLTVQQAFAHMQRLANAGARTAAAATAAEDNGVAAIELLAAGIAGQDTGLTWAVVKHCAPTGDRVVLRVGAGGELELVLPVPLTSSGLAPPDCDAAVRLQRPGDADVTVGLNCRAVPAELLVRELLARSTAATSAPAAGGPSFSVAGLIAAVAAVLDKYSSYTTSMADIDSHLWVLEPAGVSSITLDGGGHDEYAACLTPCFGSTPTRKVLLEATTGVSVSFSVDPDNPRRRPQLQFHGAPEAMQRLQSCLASGARLWDEALLPRENIARVFAGDGASLPTRAEQRQQAASQALAQSEEHLLCGICYSYQLVGGDIGAGSSLGLGQQQQQSQQPVVAEVPTEVCASSRCGKKFHKRCLFRWLSSLPSTKRSFGLLFGKCPFCSDPLNIRVTR